MFFRCCDRDFNSCGANNIQINLVSFYISVTSLRICVILSQRLFSFIIHDNAHPFVNVSML